MKSKITTKVCIITVSGIVASYIYKNGVDKSISEFYKTMIGLGDKFTNL